MRAQKAVNHLIFQEWQLQSADKAINNLASTHDFEGKPMIENAAEWKERLVYSSRLVAKLNV